MTLRFSALLVAVAAAGALSCSSKDTPPTSGGAAFQLQGADPTAAGMLGSCPDSGRDFLIAQVGDDGKNKLVADGADGASMHCAIDGSHFEIKATYKDSSLSVSGSYSGNKSSDAQAIITFGSNISYQTKGTTCTVTFTTNSAGSVVDDGGKIFANFSCPALKHKTLDAACGVDVSGGSHAYFQFSNCTGF
ncbi:MAG: hypothetical protein ACXWUG_06745 [Polyangiales bacterium]